MKALIDTFNKTKVLVGTACERIKECLVADVGRVVLQLVSLEMRLLLQSISQPRMHQFGKSLCCSLKTRRGTATEIFQIDASWAEKLTETRVSFLMTPTVGNRSRCWRWWGRDCGRLWLNRSRINSPGLSESRIYTPSYTEQCALGHRDHGGIAAELTYNILDVS